MTIQPMRRNGDMRLCFPDWSSRFPASVIAAGQCLVAESDACAYIPYGLRGVPMGIFVGSCAAGWDMDCAFEASKYNLGANDIMLVGAGERKIKWV